MRSWKNTWLDFNCRELKSSPSGMGKVSLVESYCLFQNNELYVRGMQMADYAGGAITNMYRVVTENS